MPDLSYDTRTDEKPPMPTLDELQEKYPEKLPSLIGVDGNAFAVMGHFRRHARRADWDHPDIDAVLKHAQSGDYNNLLATISRFTD